jgi:hypothetical protein
MRFLVHALAVSLGLGSLACGSLFAPKHFGDLAWDERYVDVCTAGAKAGGVDLARAYAVSCGNRFQHLVSRHEGNGARARELPSSQLHNANLVLDCERCAKDNGWSDTADASFYAESVRVDELKADLAGKRMPEEMLEAYVRGFEFRREAIRAFIAKQGPRYRAVYIDPIWQARKAWNAERAALREVETHALIERQRVVDAVATSSVTKGDADALFKLRDEYVEVCQKRGRDVLECLSGPVAYPLTHTAIHAAAQTGGVARALAEFEILRRLTPRTGVGDAVRFAVGESMRREAALLKKWQKAESLGATRAAMSAKFGTVKPLDIGGRSNAVGEVGRVTAALGTLSPKSIGKHGAKDVELLTWELVRVERTRERARLHFKEHVRTHQTPTSCTTTGRVHRINPGGYIEYEEVCQYAPVTERKRPKPVDVSVAEARALVPGDYVEVRLNKATRQGALVRVHADEKAHRTHLPPKQVLRFPLARASAEALTADD